MAPLPPASIGILPPEPSMRRPALAAVATIAVVFGGLLGWATLSTLESATVADGSTVVEARHKTVNSLDAGILRELLVAEGQTVEAGQPLLRLDNTQAQADYVRSKIEYWAAKASVARLTSEHGDRRSMDLSDDLAAAARAEPTVAILVESQRKLFEARWKTFDSTTESQTRTTDQLREQIAATEAERSALEERLRYTDERLGDIKYLYSKGFQTKPTLLGLQSDAADTTGRIRQAVANKAAAEQQIAAAKLQVVTTRNTRLSEIAHDLSDALAEVAASEQRLRAAAEVLSRREICAPEAGIVTDLKYATPGGTIAAGQPILDIVPSDSRLLVEARVPPVDAERVRVGMKSFVQLLSYRTTTVPVVPGNVVYLSADQQINEKGDAFFIARIELDKDAVAALKVKIVPGMPTRVFIVHKKRKTIDYFVSPFTDAFRNAFREE